jgi:hypothetical protein
MFGTKLMKLRDFIVYGAGVVRHAPQIYGHVLDFGSQRQGVPKELTKQNVFTEEVLYQRGGFAASTL